MNIRDGEDLLILSGINVYTYLGVNSWEKVQYRCLILDLVLPISCSQIARSDDIHYAIDYQRVSESLINFSRNLSCNLLETFAEKIADYILAHFPISWLKLTVYKPNILVSVSSVGITIHRRKLEV